MNLVAEVMQMSAPRLRGCANMGASMLLSTTEMAPPCASTLLSAWSHYGRAMRTLHSFTPCAVERGVYTASTSRAAVGSVPMLLGSLSRLVPSLTAC